MRRFSYQVAGITGIVLFIALLSSCNVQEGPGGLATITGRVYANDYNADFSQLNGSYYAPDEDVFLIYGDDEIYSDDMKTHFDGSFRFQFLRKGTYSLFAYTKDSTGTIPSGVSPVLIEVEITSKNQTVDVGEIVILK